MKIGILGHGSIGSRHARNLRTLGHTVIYHDPADEDSMARDTVIQHADAIVIASPTAIHDANIFYCQRAEKPCFVEKPIADDFDNDLKNALIYPLMVGYNLRFHPCVIKAKEWIGDGRIGEPLWANFLCGQFSDKPEYLRDGVTLNWSHEIDLALHLLGPGKVVTAAITPKDDLADIILRHNIIRCQTTIHLDYLTQPEHRGFNIVGDRSIMIANIPGRSIALIDQDGNVKQVENYKGSYDDDYLAEMVAFIDRIEGKETLGCTAKEAMDVLEVCLTAKKKSKK